MAVHAKRLDFINGLEVLIISFTVSLGRKALDLAADGLEELGRVLNFLLFSGHFYVFCKLCKML